jgi:HSP20 family protein
MRAAGDARHWRKEISMLINAMNPWNEVADLHRDLNAIVNRVIQAMERSSATGVLSPSTDLVQDDQGWKLSVAVPGIDPSNLDITMQGRTITVRGVRVPEKEGVTDSTNVTFERQVTLPDDVDPEQVKAQYHLGMLELTLPLRESAKPRRIEIEGVPEVKRLKAA